MANDILQSILNHYQLPEISIRAEISKKKRVQRKSINRPIRYVYSDHPNPSTKDIQQYNKSRFCVEYLIDMRSYPNTKQDSLRFRNDKPFNLLTASMSEIATGAATYQLETLTVKLERFGWCYRLKKEQWNRFEDIKELGNQELKRAIYSHYKNFLAGKING